MSTLTDEPKKRLITDYYGDGNKSLLLQDIEESSVKEFVSRVIVVMNNKILLLI